MTIDDSLFNVSDDGAFSLDPVSPTPDDTIGTTPGDAAVSPAIGLDDGTDTTIPAQPATLPTLPQAGAEPVFSHPDDQYLHYAGTVLDHATQYRDANGTLPAGQDLADIVGNAHAEAYGAGAAAAPQQAAAPAKAGTPPADGQAADTSKNVEGIVKTNPYAGSKALGAAAILGTAAEGMGTVLAPEFVLPALGLGYAVSRLAQSGDGAPQQTTIADPNAGKPQVLPGSDPSQSQPQPGTPPSQPPQPLPPIPPTVAPNPPSSTIAGSSAQPQEKPEPMEIKKVDPIDHSAGGLPHPETQKALDAIPDPKARQAVTGVVFGSGTTTNADHQGTNIDGQGTFDSARADQARIAKGMGVDPSSVKEDKGAYVLPNPAGGATVVARPTSTSTGEPTLDVHIQRPEGGPPYRIKRRYLP